LVHSSYHWQIMPDSSGEKWGQLRSSLHHGWHEAGYGNWWLIVVCVVNMVKVDMGQSSNTV